MIKSHPRKTRHSVLVSTVLTLLLHKEERTYSQTRRILEKECHRRHTKLITTCDQSLDYFLKVLLDLDFILRHYNQTVSLRQTTTKTSHVDRNAKQVSTKLQTHDSVTSDQVPSSAGSQLLRKTASEHLQHLSLGLSHESLLATTLSNRTT